MSVDAREDSDSVRCLSVSDSGHNGKFNVTQFNERICDEQLPKCAKSSGVSRHLLYFNFASVS